MICPRRPSLSKVFKIIDDEDHWVEVGKWHCCSYCGSMKPDEVIESIKELGIEIVSETDKGYKRYISLPNVKNAMEGPIKFYTYHFTQNEIDEYNKIIMENT